MRLVSKRALLATTLIAPLVLTGCSIVDTFAVLTPKEKGSKRVIKSQNYGDNPRQTLDVYTPDVANGSQNSWPIIVFFYGGGWDSGSKEIYTWAGRALAALGYVVIIPDYRIVPEVVYPAFLDDCAMAVNYAYQHAHGWGGDKDRLVLMGHSAGAYNAAMLALDARFKMPKLSAVVGISGPYDFYPFDVPAAKAAFGNWPKGEETQPIFYARALKTPFLLLQSRSDIVVRTKNATALEAALKSLNTPVTLKLYDGVSHQDMVACLSIPFRGKAPVLKDTEDFLRGVFKA